MSTTSLVARDHGTELALEDQRDYVTMIIGGQLFGIPVLKVQDVLGPQQITRIPLAPREVAGSLNLRGRIVTAVDVRLRLAMPRPAEGQSAGMSVVVDHKGELYSLIIDQVGEVLSFSDSTFERSPPTLDPALRDVAAGIFRLDDRLMVVLDIGRLLDFSQANAA